MNPWSTSCSTGTSAAVARPPDAAQGMGTGPAAAGAAVSKTKRRFKKKLFKMSSLLGGCGGCGGCGKYSRP